MGSADAIVADENVCNLNFSPLDSSFDLHSSLVQALSTSASKVDWFVAPETWKITKDFENSATAPASLATMKKYISRVQSWMTCWAITGSSPFIHARLYSAKFPASVQIAYATLASYVHRTPANASMVLQIVEDRSNELLRENGAVLEGGSMDTWVDEGEQDIDLFWHLARMHALLVYQVIGLFDGDVRCRHVAEGHIDVQTSWAAKLLHSAGRAFANLDDTKVTEIIGCLPRMTSYAQQHWHLWILSETVRRTWLVAASVGPVYKAQQQRWSTCPGSIMFTNRSGLWDALTASEWEHRCSTSSVAFLQRFEFAKISGLVNPTDMDEFGTAMLDMTCNGELLESWRSGSFHASNVL